MSARVRRVQQLGDDTLDARRLQARHSHLDEVVDETATDRGGCIPCHRAS
jgi:hypothetical protein